MKTLVRSIQVALVLVLAVTLVGAASAQERPVREETIIFDVINNRIPNPELWNPTVPGFSVNYAGASQAVFEPLFILNRVTGEAEPWLGESMTANDTMDVWTLKLHDGVKWHDGEAFNADDVVFTVNLMLGNAPELNYSAAIAQWVGSVEKIDDLTVQFNLSKPNPRFQMDYFSVKITADFKIVPEHIWHDKDPLTFSFFDPEQGWPFGTGPYVPVSFNESEIVYERDDNWWGVEAGLRDRLPHPRWLIWTAAGAEEVRVAAMIDDQLDSLMDISVGAWEALEEQNPNVIGYSEAIPAWVPDPCPRSIAINNMVEPWDDPDMRWALNHAIDRQEVLDFAYEGIALPGRTMIAEYPALSALIDKFLATDIYDEYSLLEYNPDKTAEILESKGYAKNADGYWEKDGEVLSLKIDGYADLVELNRMAVVIVEQLQRAGIDASHIQIAGSVWSDNLANGNFTAAADWAACGSITEPWATMDVFNVKWFTPIGERASGNRVRWSGPNAEAYSALVDQIGTLPLGDPKIEELFIEAMGYWTTDLPFIPVIQARKLVPFNTTYWTGWPNGDDNNYTWPCTWCTSSHLIIHNLEPTGGE